MGIIANTIKFNLSHVNNVQLSKQKDIPFDQLRSFIYPNLVLFYISSFSVKPLRSKITTHINALVLANSLITTQL